MKHLTVNEQGQIQIVGKWKAGELLAIAEEVRRVALEIEVDFGPAPQQPPNAAKDEQ